MSDLRTLLQPQKKDGRRSVLQAAMIKSGNQADIAKRAGFAPGTVSPLVGALRDEGLLEIRGGARPGVPDNIRVARVRGFAVGIELGYRRTGIVARRVDQSHDEAEVDWIRNGVATMSLDALFGDISQSLLALADQLGEDPMDVASVGLAVVRMVDPRSQELTLPLLPPWKQDANPAAQFARHLRGLMGDELVPRVSMDNRANLGALGESVYGEHKSAETLIYIKASTGIGAGIVIGGQLIRGSSGVAGEIGHAMINPHGRVCVCGGRGCLETIVGADSLVEQARPGFAGRAVQAPRSIDDLVAGADRGDAVCIRVLKDAAEVMGAALGNVCNLLNPNVIVLGGAWGRIANPALILEPCRRGLESTAMAAATGSRFDLVVSRLPEAAAHGALAMGINACFDAAP